MTTEQHRILYNMGMRLSCNNSLKMHLCPNKDDYEYFVYWSEASKRKGIKFGGIIDKKKIQLKQRTGKERILLGENISICERYTAEKRVEMILADSCKKEECDNLIKEFDSLLVQYIRDVAIEKALVLKINMDGWDMPMMDFTDVFDERALLVHFRSLINCFMEEIVSGSQGNGLINRTTELLYNWEKIYEEKENVLGQIEYCMSTIISGIECISEVPDDLGYLFGSIKEDFNKKRNAGDNLSFLLLDEYSRQCYQECVTILDALLRVYAGNEADVLLHCLEKYKDESLQIEKIRKLSKIDLQSSKAKKANIKLIREYLADKVKYSTGTMIECIA